MRAWTKAAVGAAVACTVALGLAAGRREASFGVVTPRPAETKVAQVAGARHEQAVEAEPGAEWAPGCMKVRCAGFPTRLAFSGDGETLAAGTLRGLDGRGPSLEVIDVRSGRSRRSLAVEDTVCALTFLDDMKTLASAEGETKGVLRLWDYASGTERAHWRPRPEGSYSNQVLAISPDGRHAVVATGMERTRPRLQVYELPSDRAVRTLPLMSWWSGPTLPHFGAFSPDGRWFAASSDLVTEGGAGQYMLFDAQSWVLVRSVYTPDRPDARIGKVNYESEECADEEEAHELAFSGDGRLLAIGCAMGVTVRAAATGERLYHFDYSSKQVVLSPDGRLLVTRGRKLDGGVTLHDLETGTVVDWPVYTDTGAQEGAVSFAFSPDGKLLATGCSDDSVRLWNLDEIREAG